MRDLPEASGLGLRLSSPCHHMSPNSPVRWDGWSRFKAPETMPEFLNLPIVFNWLPPGWGWEKLIPAIDYPHRQPSCASACHDGVPLAAASLVVYSLHKHVLCSSRTHLLLYQSSLSGDNMIGFGHSCLRSSR